MTKLINRCVYFLGCNVDQLESKLEAIIGDNKIKVRTILRRIGDGKIIFWSVMPTIKLNCDRLDLMRSLAKKGIEDD